MAKPKAIKPFVVVDTSAAIAGRPHIVFPAAQEGFVHIVYDSIAHSDAFGFMPIQQRTHVVGAIGPGKRYQVPEEGKYSLPSILSQFRKKLLEFGGAPEAVVTLSSVLGLSSSEIEGITNIMADKLSKKKDAPVEKAAKAPKAEGTAVKPKGNAEALKKAREAKDTGPDLRKLTLVKKENPYRDGSGRAAAFDALKGAKTVQEYVDAGGKKKYIARWEEEGIITVK